MKFLYGTNNPAKLELMRRWLAGMSVEIAGLGDLKQPAPEAPETGCTPLENARQKATAYYREYHMPVFSCDSGLYIEGLPQELQPGVHVRTIKGRYCTDEEMLAYYSALARKYGRPVARYRNAICLVINENLIYESMAPELGGEPFRLSDVPHPRIRRGFPLDSLSLEPVTGKYYYDLEGDFLEEDAEKNGFRSFFRKVLEEQGVKESDSEHYPKEAGQAFI